MSEPQHENILIEGIKEGNEKIFDYLFHLYYSSLVVYVQKFVADRVVAEDIVQEFFVKLWVDRKNLQVKQSIKSYFFTAIKNRCIDFLRHKKVKTKSDAFIQQTTEIASNDHNLLLESELREYIQLALEKLPPVCREVFVMNRFDGLKPGEIAERKGISVRTVEGHIGKALRIMKNELENYLPATLVAVLLNAVPFN